MNSKDTDDVKIGCSASIGAAYKKTPTLLSRDAFLNLSPIKTYEIYLATYMALEATKESLEKLTEEA